MDAKGFKFLKTLRSNDMDSWGNLVTGLGAASEPPWALQMNVLMANPILGSRSFPVLSAPPMFSSYNLLVPLPRTMAMEHMPQTLNLYLIANTQGKSILTKIPMTRVYNNQNMAVL